MAPITMYALFCFSCLPCSCLKFELTVCLSLLFHRLFCVVQRNQQVVTRIRILLLFALYSRQLNSETLVRCSKLPVHCPLFFFLMLRIDLFRPFSSKFSLSRVICSVAVFAALCFVYDFYPTATSLM